MSHPQINTRSSSDIAGVVSAVLAKAGVAISTQPQAVIIPLRDVIAENSPLRVIEVQGLTYHRASQVLSAETGYPISVPTMEDRPLAGFLSVSVHGGAIYGCILLKQEDPVVRRRFSAAHEFGHYMLHFLPYLQQLSDDNGSIDSILAEALSYSSDNDPHPEMPLGRLMFTRPMTSDNWEPMLRNEQLEREANSFAAQVLMPEVTCRTMMDSFLGIASRPGSVIARRLATVFLVSQEAMKWRLTNLHLL